MDPHTSIPKISFVGYIFNKLLLNVSATIFSVFLFLVPSARPVGVSFIKSFAKLGPDITAILFVGRILYGIVSKELKY